jgi:phosphoglycolate phosphatase-like HAD superfamily hydrolase
MSNNKIKLIILDGGGTVWDSMHVLYESYLWGFDKLGIGREKFPVSFEEANALSALKDFNTEHGKAKGFLALYLLGMKAKDSFYSLMIQTKTEKENPR